MTLEFPEDKSPIVIIGDVLEKLKELKEEIVLDPFTDSGTTGKTAS